MLLEYGLKNNELVHVDKVATGVACRCVCPNCGERLIAKNRAGNKKIAHFSHVSGATCAGGVQTALHLLAKKLIAESDYIYLPSVKWDFVGRLSNLPLQPTDYDFRPYYECNKRKLLIEKVFVENRLGRIIPDIIVESFGKQYLLEVAVTHFVNSEKREKLALLDLDCIEIDISSLRNDFTEEKLKHLVIDDSPLKYWVHNRHYKIARDEIVTAYNFRNTEYLEKHAWPKLNKKDGDESKGGNLSVSEVEEAYSDRRPSRYTRRIISYHLNGGIPVKLKVDFCPKAAIDQFTGEREKIFLDVQCKVCLHFDRMIRTDSSFLCKLPNPNHQQ